METQESKEKRKKDSKFVKKLKQRIYTWHRIIGIITVIPVIFWCLSGVMHPFMAHFFKPEIPNERYQAPTLLQSQLPLSINTVLNQNKIDEILNFKIVSFENAVYYQVKTTDTKLHYFNTTTGLELTNGDARYAEWLSRYFLEDQKSKVISSEIVTTFDSQYKYVNRYLPVYKLTFDRPDGMEIYVETASSKLATFNPKSRQFFIWFFDTFHNWSFLDAISNTAVRVWIMVLLLSIIGISALSGIVIYGLFWKQFKKQPQPTDQPSRFRKHHRKIGIAVAFVTLTFAFSGGYHALTKLKPNVLPKMVYEPTIALQDLKIENTVLTFDWSKFKNCSVIKMNDTVYYQVQTGKGPKKTVTTYLDALNGKVHPNKEQAYAEFLAQTFSEMYLKNAACCEMQEPECKASTDISEAKLLETKTLYEFEKREYGFVNKRLPVIKLAYDTPDKTTYYIDTATSHLATVVTNADRLEGYSFAILHKFLFMDWAGKGIRDLVTVLAAMGVLMVSLLGLYLFLKKK
jgi:hypothetical protein